MAIFLFIQETANAFLSVYTPFDSDDTFALRGPLSISKQRLSCIFRMRPQQDPDGEIENSGKSIFERQYTRTKYKFYIPTKARISTRNMCKIDFSWIRVLTIGYSFEFGPARFRRKISLLTRVHFGLHNCDHYFCDHYVCDHFDLISNFQILLAGRWRYYLCTLPSYY